VDVVKRLAVLADPVACTGAGWIGDREVAALRRLPDEDQGKRRAAQRHLADQFRTQRRLCGRQEGGYIDGVDRWDVADIRYDPDDGRQDRTGRLPGEDRHSHVFVEPLRQDLEAPRIKDSCAGRAVILGSAPLTLVR
jgi:hypothetical protein